MDDVPTLMAVHAHPDDESSSTGGILARYADEGLRTIVVTCTNGEFGDAPGGIKPGTPGHDPEEVARIRRGELERACALLGVHELELLGYHDSGMADWEYRDSADAFCNVPIREGADRLVQLFEKHRPDIVVTYADDAGYDHPDHVHATRVTMAALERSEIPKKAYWSLIRASTFSRFRDLLVEQGIEGDFPEPEPEIVQRMRELEQRITTTIDVSQFVNRKRAALRTHASQIEESFFAKLPPDAFDTIFAAEDYIRVHDTTASVVPENDMFNGVR
ncbi:MAG TPA: PIG-L family deacetylase [Acidimicrobiia bacterium]|jgi:LmbE family N-acetylglucosaminyl deacetylase